MPDAYPVATRLDEDRKDLLDLSLRNPLLNHRPRARGLETVGESPAKVFRLLVREGRALSFLPAPEETDENTENAGEPSGSARLAVLPPVDPSDLRLHTLLGAEALQGRLLAIYYASRSSVEEQGVNTLFLALGLLTWYETTSSSKPLRAPLVLVPVALERSSARERFRLRFDGEDLDTNLSLAEKLRTEYGLTLPDLPDADELDVDRYFDAVGGAVREQPRWAVERRAVVLGFFSFAKFLMYRDLDRSNWPEGSPPVGEPMLRALLSDCGFERPASPPGEDEWLDGREGVEDLRLVLDADSTQTLALLDAAAGRPLVIQGPPGTGKSQTITNLIADAIGRNEKVLFVAEKLAALEVVKRRLDAVGLGHACLELHSHKIRKKAALDQIRRTLNATRPRDGPGDEVIRRRRDELRLQLNAYCAALHAPIGASGVTPHRAIGELLLLRQRLGDEEPPPLDLPTLPHWTAAEFRRRLALVERMQDRLATLGDPRAHPFRGCRRTALWPGDEDRLRERLRVTRHATSALKEASAALARFLRLPAADGRAASEGLVRAARRVAEAARWQGALVRGEWLSRYEDLRELLDAGAAVAELHRRFDPILLGEAWDLDLGDLRQTLNRQGRRWWRPVLPAYRRARDRLAALCRAAPPGRLDDQLALIDAVQESRRLRAVIARHEALAARLFGRRWRGERSDWAALRDVADGLHRLHADVRDGHLPRGLLDFLADAPALAGLETLTRAVASELPAHDSAVRGLLNFLEFDDGTRTDEGGRAIDRPFDEQIRVLDRWASEIRALDPLTLVNRLAEHCRTEGLGALAALAETWAGPGRSLADALRFHWYQSLLRRAFQEHPAELGEFMGSAHERAIAEFSRLDRCGLERDRARIAREHWVQLPKHGAGGQLGVLRRELVKKARHLPVRQLMARAGRAIQAATPVFLMSPLSVAAYLPPGSLDFDLIVFDEASQVKPVDALGALLRGRQAVVVGDSRQLPPTTFFDRLTGGDDAADDEDEAPRSADVESILGLFVAQGAPERMLRWHYRSRHESLIAVSNHGFYDGRLIVFPSPDADRSRAGLMLRHLPDTIYERGKSRTNPGEADAVARAILDFARAQLECPPGQRLTLGVATFSAAQMQAVLDRLERLRREDPACEDFFGPGADEPFFIKNLENVQGDERDVIFISIGYGRTAEGTVPLNFGPLNAEGGERRLNVLITRARMRCEVFTNLTADDLDPARTRSRGVLALRDFLAYARTGRLEATAGIVASAAEPGPFESAVGAALAGAGFPVRVRIGPEGSVLALAVLDPEPPGRYVLGLECDGATYRAARSARDRDRLRLQVLESLGWRLHRLWAPDWLRDPAAERARALAAIRRAQTPPGRGPGDQPPGAPAPPAPDPSRDPPEEPAETDPAPSPPELPAYRMADLSARLADVDPTGLEVADLADLVAEVARVEGPVHVAEVARRIVEAAEVKRTSPRLQQAIEAAAGYATTVGTVRRRGDFLWPEGGSTPPVVRDRGGLPPASRRLELVAPEELAGAVERVVRDGYGMERGEVPAAVCRLLGFPRTTDDMRHQVEAVIGDMVQVRRLVAQADHLVVADLQADR